MNQNSSEPPFYNVFSLAWMPRFSGFCDFFLIQLGMGGSSRACPSDGPRSDRSIIKGEMLDWRCWSDVEKGPPEGTDIDHQLCSPLYTSILLYPESCWSISNDLYSQKQDHSH